MFLVVQGAERFGEGWVLEVDGRLKVEECWGLGVQLFEDSKVLGEGSGAKTGVFFIRQVQIHEGLCPVMCCVRVCVGFCFLLRFWFCDVCDTCLVWDV